MKHKILLPAIFVMVFALSRIPGLMPSNFSVVYAFAFCSGVFFPGRPGWYLPLTVIFVTDMGLNFYYQHRYPDANVWGAANLANLAFNYLAYAVLIFLGRCFKPRPSLMNLAGLVGGGILGAILFYFITNTAAWLFNPFHVPEYTKNLPGWIRALTTGSSGYPPTWEFFRHTLMSGGLFTALFGAAGWLAAESPADQSAGASEPEDREDSPPAPAPAPEEAKA